MATKAKDVGVLESEAPDIEAESAPAVLPTFADIYERLAAPFEKTFQRQIAGGNKLTYINKEQVVSRLTEVLGGNWDWAVDRAEVIGDHVIVSGTLTVKGGDIFASRAGYGGSAIKKARGSNDILDLGNDVKAAESSAFKRAASLFGVGLYLYEKSEDNSELPGQSSSYGTAGTYAPSGSQPAVQFAASGSVEGGTTGPVEAVSMPRMVDGKQKLGGIKVNGAWFNVSNRAPIDLSTVQRGQVLTVQHGPGSNFIDGLAAPGQGAPTESEGEVVDAF